ncbi:RsbRD N-terminal domain-containing protein [Actinomadura sp. NPDC049382]|uniref:RsbRD N-terminal domain-containing protein n=1 Tax=Actinomadura sp. NPDC049382 TaxID=3158220 RepID=UPI0034335727
MEPGAGDRFLRLLIEHGDDPALLEATVRAARGRSELVAALPEEETRRHTRALVRGVVSALRGGGPSEEVLAAAARLGSDRARQGVPVEAFLDGFQAGRAHLVRTVVAGGRRLGVPDAELLDGVTRIDEITTALVHRMVQAHRVAELELARTARETRGQLLRRLLHGEAVAVRAPLDPAAAYHCVVSDVSDPEVAARLEEELTAAAPGLCGLVDGRFAALVPRLPDPVPSGPPGSRRCTGSGAARCGRAPPRASPGGGSWPTWRCSPSPRPSRSSAGCSPPRCCPGWTRTTRSTGSWPRRRWPTSTTAAGSARRRRRCTSTAIR